MMGLADYKEHHICLEDAQDLLEEGGFDKDGIFGYMDNADLSEGDDLRGLLSLEYGINVDDGYGKEEHVLQVVQVAQERLWEEVVKSFPTAIHGDLSPERVTVLDSAIEYAIREWVEFNVNDDRGE